MTLSCRCENPVAVINDMTLCGHCDQPCTTNDCQACDNIRITA